MSNSMVTKESIEADIDETLLDLEMVRDELVKAQMGDKAGLLDEAFLARELEKLQKRLTKLLRAARVAS
jgi:hypothetical protein